MVFPSPPSLSRKVYLHLLRWIIKWRLSAARRAFLLTSRVPILLWRWLKRFVVWASAELYGGVLWCREHLWRWPWVAGIALALIGIGANAMFGGMFDIARVLIYFGLGLLAGKAVSEVRGQERWLGIIAIILLVGGGFLFTSEYIIASVDRKIQSERAIQRPSPTVKAEPTGSELSSPSPQPTTMVTTISPTPAPSPSPSARKPRNKPSKADAEQLRQRRLLRDLGLKTP